MTQYNIPEPISIPFFDHDKKLSKTIKKSSTRRKMSPIHFVLHKIKNILLDRLAFFCPLNGWRIRMHKWRGVHIGKNVYIGIHCLLDNAYPEYIYIEDNAAIAPEVTIIAHSNPYAHFASIMPSQVQPTIVRNGAWIGMKSLIHPGVTVGIKAIVAAGTMVDKNVPDYTLVKGNPMKEVSRYKFLQKDLKD